MAAVGEAGPMGPPRDTEGLVLSLYHHLWLKDQHGQSCAVNIPHTVLFQNSKPVAWYFTSLKAGTILRKKRGNMEGPAMAEVFMSGRASQPHVCAWFSGQMTQLQSSARKARWGPDSKERDTDELAMEYLTYDRVQSILNPGPDHAAAGEHLYDGLMQRFVEPRDMQDFVIRVQWSPTSSTLEKRVSRHRLDGADGTPLPDRIASYFYSPSHHQCLPIVEGMLQNRLQAQCAAMAAHVKDVTRGQSVIAHMELFFKIDGQNRIWLLYCSSLRLEVVPPLRVVYNREIQGSAFVLKDPTRSEQVQLAGSGEGTFVCALTGETLTIEQRSQVTYQLIMQHWFVKCSDIVSEAERIQAMDAIPPALRRANPNMSRDYFLRNRSQPFFLKSLADVSHDSAAQLAQAQGCDLAASIGKPRASQPGTSLARPASAAARLLPGNYSAASSPMRFGSQDGGGRMRPSSCSALSRARNSSIPSSPNPRSHWHQRVTSTPAGVSGAVVTPHTTGRAVPVSPLRRPPQSPRGTSNGRRYSAADASPSPAGTSPFPSMLVPKVVSDTYAQLKAQAMKGTSGYPTSGHNTWGGSAPNGSATGASGPSASTTVSPWQTPPQPLTQRSSQPLPTPVSPSRGEPSSSPQLGTISEEALARGPGVVRSHSAAGQTGSQPQQVPPGMAGALAEGTSPFTSALPRAGTGTGTDALMATGMGIGTGTGTGGGPSGPALSDSMRSSGSQGSRRGQVGADEARTLKELADAYSEAEQLTKALLEQANHLLRTPSSGATPATAATAAPAATSTVSGSGAVASDRSQAGTAGMGRASSDAAQTPEVIRTSGGVSRLQSSTPSRPSAVPPGAAAAFAMQEAFQRCALPASQPGPLPSQAAARTASGGTTGKSDALSLSQRPSLTSLGSSSTSLPPRPVSALLKSGSGGSARPMSARPRASPDSLQLQKSGSDVPSDVLSSSRSSSLARSLIPASDVPATVTALTAEEQELLFEAVTEPLL